MTVVHLTAELAPMPGGIADYVAILGGELARHGLDQRYLVTGTANGRRPAPETFAGRDDVVVLRFPSSGELTRVLGDLDPSSVLLHYSGYGFARRGAPVWLVTGLSAWKRARPGSRLVVMFHETWASSTVPWQSSFWLSSLQKACVRRLVRLADVVVTNTQFYAQRLRGLLRSHVPLRVQPIFSNVGEPEQVPPFEDRHPICVVFGRGGHRRRTWERFRPYFARLGELGIERIVEIGSEPEATVGLEWPLPAERLGPLPAAAVSAHLLQARFGLFECPVRLACKSGVFLALTAHGVVALTPDGRGRHDGFEHGRWSLCLADGAPSEAPARAGIAAHRWYRRHRLARQARNVWLAALAR